MAPQTPPAWAAVGFAEGTFVQTNRGLRQIERLVPGADLLEFRDGTTAPLLAVHRAAYDAAALVAAPSLQPFVIPALALGGRLPVRAMHVAGSMHILAGGRLVNRMAEREEVLIPLQTLDGYNGIERVLPPGGVTYYHLVAAEHGVIRADGLMAETLFLGAGTDAALIDATRAAAPDAKAEAPALPRLAPEMAARLAAKLMAKNRTLGSPETAEG